MVKMIFVNTEAVTSTSTLAVAIAKGIPFIAARRAVSMSPCRLRAAGRRSLTDSPSRVHPEAGAHRQAIMLRNQRQPAARVCQHADEMQHQDK